MKFLFITLFLFSLNANACWKVEGHLSINGAKVDFNQRLDHDKTYSFQASNYLFHVTIPSKPNLPSQMKPSKDVHLINIQIQQKEGVKLSHLTQDKMLVRSGQEATMTKEDDKKKLLSSYTFKITDI